MKFRLLTLLITKLLGVDEEAKKADMHLPEWIAGFGLASILGGFILVALSIIGENIPFLIFGIIFFVIAPFALLCYKNQRIYILSEDEFEYSTFLGNKKIYKFANIKKLRANKDSMTMFIDDGELHKVHIESSAVMSQRLIDHINKALAEARESKKEKKQ